MRITRNNVGSKKIFASLVLTLTLLATYLGFNFWVSGTWTKRSSAALPKYLEVSMSHEALVYSNSTHVAFYNGTTGKREACGIDGGIILNWAIGNLTSERTWKETVFVRGSFEIDANVKLEHHTTLNLSQAKITFADGSNRNFYLDCRNVHDVELVMGDVDGNRKGQTEGNGACIGITKGSYNVTVRIRGVIKECQRGIVILQNTTHDITILSEGGRIEHSGNNHLKIAGGYNHKIVNFVGNHTYEGDGVAIYEQYPPLRDVELIDPIISYSADDGIGILGGDNLRIVGGISHHNGDPDNPNSEGDGLTISGNENCGGSNNVVVSGFTSYNNNMRGCATEAGIKIRRISGTERQKSILLIGCRSYDDRSPKHQKYGLWVWDSSVDGLIVEDCNFADSGWRGNIMVGLENYNVTVRNGLGNG